MEPSFPSLQTHSAANDESAVGLSGVDGICQKRHASLLQMRIQIV